MAILPPKKSQGQARPPSPHSGTGGQALIILLLVMVIGLTIGLSVATRSTTDIRIATQHAFSQKAFSAAEAGIEDALRRDLGKVAQGSGKLTSSLGSDASFEVKVKAQGGTRSFVVDKPIVQDDVAQIILAPPQTPSPTDLNVYWVSKSDSSESSPRASLEITEVYLEGGEYKINKYAFNPNCAGSSDTGEVNNFMSGYSCSDTDNNIGGRNFDLGVRIPLSASPKVPQLLRIRPLYNKTSVAVDAYPGNTTLPIQSYLIESTGISGDVSRKLQVSRSLEALPSIFDYAIYSGTSLTK